MIRGRIGDVDGRPLSGASIGIEGTFRGTHSAEDGSYYLDGLKDGIYRLRFSFIGYESQLISVELAGEVVLDVILQEKSFLAGEVIVNATRAGSRSPMAYTSVDRETVSDRNSGLDLPFLLSLTPSLVETSESGNGIGYTSLRIRGTDASRINVTVDGIPANDSESQQVFWVNLPDMASSVDNIQVQRGAGTSSNGSGAFGATLNIQTTTAGNEPFAQIGTSLGSFNTSRKMIAAGTGLLADRFAFGLRLSDVKSDGYVDRTGSDHRSAFINGILRGTRSSLKAGIILGEEHTGIGWVGVPAEMLSVNRKYNPAGEYTDMNGVVRYYDNESDNYRQNHYRIVYDARRGENFSFSSALHYTHGTGYYEQYRENARLSSYGLPEISLNGSVITRSDLVRRKWMKNDFYGLVSSFRYRNEKLEAVLGGGASHYSGDHYGRLIWMRHTGDLEKDHQWYLNSGIKREFSIYGKIDYSLTGKLSFFADLQYRHINYRMKGIDDDLKDLDQKHYFRFFNPKTGLFYSIDRKQDAYLSFSVARREPTRTDFKEAADDPRATPKHETLLDTELGYKRRAERYSVAANMYAMFYRDQLVPTGELSSTGRSIMTNVPKSHRLGIELISALKPAAFFNWDFSITLSRNKITGFTGYYIDYNTSDWSEEYKSKDLGTVDIAYSPSLTGVSDIEFRVFKNTDLHFISKYVGKQYFDNTMNSERMIDPYFVNNFRIDSEPVVRGLKNTRFQFMLNNIFNSMYVSNAYGGSWYEDGIEKTWAYYFPQAGINFMLRAEVLF
ncbi:MAG TPA: TonB-dependent receptor [Bacteroidales bacterium]|nr:TonB-dependent receptor [Bacteroidales bacterium]HOS72933.1 TonB-dependent receptor [Bacteroidales bacterium]